MNVIVNDMKALKETEKMSTLQLTITRFMYLFI